MVLKFIINYITSLFNLHIFLPKYKYILIYATFSFILTKKIIKFLFF